MICITQGPEISVGCPVRNDLLFHLALVSNNINNLLFWAIINIFY